MWISGLFLEGTVLFLRHTGPWGEWYSGIPALERAAGVPAEAAVQDGVEERVEAGPGIAEAGDDVGDANNQ